MSDRPDADQHVRRVVLPSGKAIDVVYFPAAAGATPEAAEPVDLRHCGTCGSDLVYPVEWEEVGTVYWQVSLRCPNCEWVGTGVFDQRSVDRFDEQLDRGIETMVHDLRRLSHANREEEIERFVAALAADAILPVDFGRPRGTRSAS
jgi:hypothetical protein